MLSMISCRFRNSSIVLMLISICTALGEWQTASLHMIAYYLSAIYDIILVVLEPSVRSTIDYNIQNVPVTNNIIPTRLPRGNAIHAVLSSYSGLCSPRPTTNNIQNKKLYIFNTAARHIFIVTSSWRPSHVENIITTRQYLPGTYHFLIQ